MAFAEIFVLKVRTFYSAVSIIPLSWLHGVSAECLADANMSAKSKPYAKILQHMNNWRTQSAQVSSLWTKRVDILVTLFFNILSRCRNVQNLLHAKHCMRKSIEWGKALHEEKHCMRKSIACQALHAKHCMPSIAWGKALHEEKPKCQWWWVYVLYCLFIYFLSAKPVTVLLLLFLKA